MVWFMRGWWWDLEQLFEHISFVKGWALESGTSCACEVVGGMLWNASPSPPTLAARVGGEIRMPVLYRQCFWRGGR